MKKFLPFLLSLVLLSGCGILSKEYVPEHKFESREDLVAYLQGNDWNFELQHVSGSYVPSTFNAYGFGFEVKGDSLVSYLPFFGISYRAPLYGDNKGPLNFEAPIVSYDVKAGTHPGEAVIELVTRKEPQNTITLYITAFTNGSATVTMLSTDTESLTYRGIITLPGHK